MCHGHIDPKTLMIEAEARYRAAQPKVDPKRTADAAATLPPELMGRLRGVWARLWVRLPGRTPPQRGLPLREQVAAE